MSIVAGAISYVLTWRVSASTHLSSKQSLFCGQLCLLLVTHTFLIGSVFAQHMNDLDTFNNIIWPALQGNSLALGEWWTCPKSITSDVPLACTNPSEPQTITHINGANRYLSGSIPTEIGLLNMLQSIKLNNNQLTGAIPVEISSLTLLDNVALENNRLCSHLPKFNITSLSYCSGYDQNCFQCDQSAPFCGISSHCSSCTCAVIWNGGTSVPQTFPPTSAPTNFPTPAPTNPPTDVSLFNTVIYPALNDSPAEHGTYTCDGVNLWCDPLGRITRIHMYSAGLGGMISTRIGELSSIEYLYLNDNQLVGSIPTELGTLSKLTSLKLHNNQLTGSVPSTLLDLHQLTSLYLQNNQLCGVLPVFNIPSCSVWQDLSDGNCFCNNDPSTPCISQDLSDNESCEGCLLCDDFPPDSTTTLTTAEILPTDETSTATSTTTDPNMSETSTTTLLSDTGIENTDTDFPTTSSRTSSSSLKATIAADPSISHSATTISTLTSSSTNYSPTSISIPSATQTKTSPHSQNNIDNMGMTSSNFPLIPVSIGGGLCCLLLLFVFVAACLFQRRRRRRQRHGSGALDANDQPVSPRRRMGAATSMRPLSPRGTTPTASPNTLQSPHANAAADRAARRSKRASTRQSRRASRHYAKIAPMGMAPAAAMAGGGTAGTMATTYASTTLFLARGGANNQSAGTAHSYDHVPGGGAGGGGHAHYDEIRLQSAPYGHVAPAAAANYLEVAPDDEVTAAAAGNYLAYAPDETASNASGPYAQAHSNMSLVSVPNNAQHYQQFQRQQQQMKAAANYLEVAPDDDTYSSVPQRATPSNYLEVAPDEGT